MREGWETVPLGDVARQSRERVVLVPGSSYPALGVLRDGRGLFEREPFVGGKTAYRFLTPVCPGQLVLRSITAWEAPIGVAEPGHTGRHVSAVFPVFDLDRSRVMPAFMSLICQYPPFWEEMRLRTTGTVMRRKLLTADALCSIPIALPPLAEQRRIVDLIGSLDDARQRLASVVGSIKVGRQTLLAAILDALVAPAQPLESVLSHVVGGAWGESPGMSDVDVDALGLRAFSVDDLTVTARFSTRRSLSLDRWASRALRRDDIILERSGGAEDKPVGRVIVADEDMQNVVPTDFMRLLRVDGSRAVPRFVFWWLWTRYHHGDTIAFQTKTTNIRNLRVGDYLQLPIPIPAPDEQDRIVDIAERFSRYLRAAQREGGSLGRARSALLAELLSGDHEIPESYDRLLDGAA